MAPYCRKVDLPKIKEAEMVLIYIGIGSSYCPLALFDKHSIDRK